MDLIWNPRLSIFVSEILKVKIFAKPAVFGDGLIPPGSFWSTAYQFSKILYLYAVREKPKTIILLRLFCVLGDYNLNF